jgi:hypothetical protein
MIMEMSVNVYMVSKLKNGKFVSAIPVLTKNIESLRYKIKEIQEKKEKSGKLYEFLNDKNYEDISVLTLENWALEQDKEIIL